MATYVIRCTDQSPRSAGHSVAHIKTVAFHGGTRCRTVKDVYALLDAGHEILSRSPGGGPNAKVHKYQCTCGYETLRSAADATKANNLDELPRCNCR